MITKKMTVRAIRKFLFDTEFFTVIGGDEMSNKESRDYLFAKENQDEIFNVLENKDHVIIY